MENDFRSVAYGAGRFVATGYGGNVYTSSDGIAWTKRNSTTGVDLRAVGWTGVQFVAVGYNGTILTSADGETWHARVSGRREQLYSVITAENLLVSVGDQGVVLTSPRDATASLAAPVRLRQGLELVRMQGGVSAFLPASLRGRPVKTALYDIAGGRLATEAALPMADGFFLPLADLKPGRYLLDIGAGDRRLSAPFTEPR
jgi:hypothetical protein